MGTVLDVTVPREGPVPPEKAAEIVLGVFEDVDHLASEWAEGSELTAVNRGAGGDPVRVSDELMGLVVRGVELGERSDGAFDITWAAMWGLWDLDAAQVPDPADITTRQALVDYRRVEMDPAATTLRLPQAGMMIGLGGIAKGHALDRSAKALREQGVTGFSLSAGGQVLVDGLFPDTPPRPWRVGIRDPRGERDAFFAWIDATDVSVATSGDYERFFVSEGKRYHHILDPRTGWPSTAARSATVVTADATVADALSTAMMVMGPAGLELIEASPGVEAVIVDTEGRVHTSSGLSDLFRVR